MRLKVILYAILGLLAPAIGYATCDSTLAPTYTTRTGIPKPAINVCGWGSSTNGNWDIVDSSGAFLGIENTFTSTNTFSKPVLFSGSQPIRFYDATTHYLEFQTPSSLTTTHFTWPSADGTSGQFLKTDGAGTLSFGASSNNSASNLAVNSNGTQVSSPTVAINFIAPPFSVSLVGGSTAQVTLNSSSVTLLGNTLNQANSLVQLDSSGRLPAVDGSLLTNIAPVTNYSQSFTAQTSVVLTHNSNTTKVVVACYDGNSPPNYIGFDSLQITDANDVTVNFATAQTGTCVVSSTGGGGGDNLGNHTATKMITANYGISASTISVSTMTASSETVNNSIISTVTWRTTGSADFRGERCAPEVQFTITSSSATTISTTFIPTSLSGSITPHSTSSYIKIQVSGPLMNTAGANALLSILKNGTNLVGTNGLQAIVAAASIQIPAGFIYTDSPATTSATTYAVGLESSGGTTATFCGSNFTCVLKLQECF